MTFEWFLAYRYFRGNRRDSGFLSFIKIMAITGIAIGSGGLLIALAIVHGFGDVIEEKIMGYGTHISIETYTDEPLYRADTLTTWLQQIPEIEASQAVVEGQGMVQTRDRVDGTMIKGVDLQGDLSDLHRYIERGVYSLERNDDGLPGVVIGDRLARSLDAEVGATLTAYAIQGMPGPLNMPQILQFHLAGIYRTGIDEFDDVFMLMERSHARSLFQIDEPRAHRVDVRLHDTRDIEQVQAHLNAELPFPYFTESIQQRHSNIFAWINLQEQTIPFVVAVMIIVAAFNLIGTVLMMVLERTRDIGILKTMGAINKKIRSIFLVEGLIVAGIGLIFGVLLSLGFYVVQDTWQIIPLPEESYYMDAAPVQPQPLDFVIVGTATLALSALASWLPARVAARMNPLAVISYGR